VYPKKPTGFFGYVPGCLNPESITPISYGTYFEQSKAQFQNTSDWPSYFYHTESQGFWQVALVFTQHNAYKNNLFLNYSLHT